MPIDKRTTVDFKLDASPFTRVLRVMTRAMVEFGDKLRLVNGRLASARCGYPLLDELDEIEWPWGTRYYRDHPMLRAYQRDHSSRHDRLVAGAARVLYAPVNTTPPTKLSDLTAENGWTDLGVVR